MPLSTSLFCVLSLVLGGCDLLLEAPNPSPLAFGNPSNAGSEPDNYLMEKPQYVLSYNRERGTANWVAWKLNPQWLGDAERQNDFRPDDSLPEDWYRVRPSDYTRSGYDRGHWTPSADRTASEADNSATFLMTNIVPQHPKNNRGPWKDLEEYCRELVDHGQELYVVAGIYGKREKIGKRKRVTAPISTWKVIVVLEQPGMGVAEISERTRIIAVEIPNRERIRDDWKKYRVSIDRLEEKTGYDFLQSVPQATQETIERRVDNLE